MLLDAILIVFTWMGVLFNFIIYIVPEDSPFSFLPFNIIGMIFFICGIVIIRWRGSSSTMWMAMDFPSTNSDNIIGITCDGSKVYLQKLQKSIATFIKNRKDWYYRDIPDSNLVMGGHNARLIDSETAYTVNPEQAIFINKLSDDFYDYEQVKDVVKKEMQQMKNKQGFYLLTGTNLPIAIENIDIISNSIHKELFEYLIEKYFINIHGRTFSLKPYHRFQEKQAAPYQIGSVIHYVKALSAMRAAGIKKGMGGWTKWIVIIMVVVIIIMILAMIMTGNLNIPGMNI